MAKTTPANHIPLVPFGQLQKAVQKVLTNSKLDSDVAIAKIQASNAKKRAAKKKAREQA